MTRTSKPAVVQEAKRCAVYTRKSTSAGLEQEFNSLHAQRDACVAYIGRQPGWTMLPDQYDDGGFTGANTDRPAFQRLMVEVEAKRVDVIVVYKVDRLSRSLLDFAKVMERLSAAGVSFVSVTQNFSTADAMGRLTLNMLMSFAEFEREMIAERTRDKIAASRRKGKWTGGPVPFGYLLKDKKLAVNDGEAAIVREAFRLHVQHRQMASVARELTARALLPRKPRICKPNKALRWTVESIGRLIANPIYAGLITCGIDRVTGEHEAIVDQHTWQTSQCLLLDRNRPRQSHGINHDYVLRGITRCGRCNAAMCPGSTRKGTRVHRYYRCSTRDKTGRQYCDASPVAAVPLEQYVVARIALVVSDGDFASGAYEETSALLQDRIALLELQRHSLTDRLAETSAHSGKLADEWVDASLDVREVLGQRLTAASSEVKLCEEGLASVRDQLRALESCKLDLEWVSRALGNFPTVWEAMSSVNRGRLLRALVDRVVIKDTKVDIHLADLDDAITCQEGNAAE